MAEFQVGEYTYRSTKMPARTQFHVLRRAAPIVGPLQAMVGGSVGAEALPIFAEAIGSLSNENCDYILDEALAVVQRKQADTIWAPIKAPNSEAMMFKDIDMVVMLQIAAHVLKDNFSALFSGGLASLTGGAAA